MVEEFGVPQQDFPNPGVFLKDRALFQIALVIVEALGRVGAGNFDIRQCRQDEHQVPDFHVDIGIAENRDICGRDKVKQELVLFGLQAVFCKAFDPDQILYRTAALLFLSGLYFHSVTSICRTAASR